MDRFYTVQKCDRCGGSLKDGRMMSRFNEDCLCHECIAEERRHPDYKRACDADHEQLCKGNYNYSGIGYPGKHGRLK